MASNNPNISPPHLWPTARVINSPLSEPSQSSGNSGTNSVEPRPIRMQSQLNRRLNNYVAEPHKLLPKPVESQYRDSSTFEEVLPAVPPQPFDPPIALSNGDIEEPPIEMVEMTDSPNDRLAESRLQPLSKAPNSYSTPEHNFTPDSGTEPDESNVVHVEPSAPPFSLRFSTEPPPVQAARLDVAVDTSEVDTELEPLPVETEAAADTSPEPMTSFGERTPSLPDVALENTFRGPTLQRRISEGSVESVDTITRMQMSTMQSSRHRTDAQTLSSRTGRSERTASCAAPCSGCASCRCCRGCCCTCFGGFDPLAKYVPEMPCACVHDYSIYESVENQSELKEVEDRVNAVMGTGAFEGVTQRELELLVNSSPRWMYLRFSLFWAFVVALLAMLVASVAMVAMAPSCPYNPEMDEYQTGLVYRLSSTLAFRDSDGDGWGDWDGITERLGYLRALGTRVLLIGPVARAASADNALLDTLDLLDTHPLLGNRTAFARLLDEAHKSDMAVFVELNVNFVSKESAIYKKFETELGTNENVNYSQMLIESALSGTWVCSGFYNEYILVLTYI